jgi:hypothetical protein
MIASSVKSNQHTGCVSIDLFCFYLTVSLQDLEIESHHMSADLINTYKNGGKHWNSSSWLDRVCDGRLLIFDIKVGIRS